MKCVLCREKDSRYVLRLSLIFVPPAKSGRKFKPTHEAEIDVCSDCGHEQVRDFEIVHDAMCLQGHR